MRKFLSILLMAAVLGAGPVTVSQAWAQNRSGEVAGALSRLKNNPRYQGRILGTYVKRTGNRYLYEVRILRPDDRIILVYIDPETGGVVGDSESRRGSRFRNPDRDRPGGGYNRDDRGNRDRGRGRR